MSEIIDASAKRLTHRTSKARSAILCWCMVYGAVLIPAILGWRFDSPCSAGTAQPAGKPLVGQVLGQDNKPVAGAIVCLVTGKEQTGPKGLIAKTDADGRFSLPAPPVPDNKPWNIDPHLFACVPGVGFSPTAALGPAELKLKISPSVDVHLTCLGPDGKPVPGLRVAPAIILGGGYLRIPREVAAVWSLKTDATGQCTFQGLPPHAQIQFATDDARFAQITLEDRVQTERAPLTAQIQLQHACTVSGFVYNPETKKPAAGIPLGLQNTNDNPAITGGFAETDANGRYQFARIKPGDYVVGLSDELMTGDWTAKAAIVHPTDGHDASADLTLTHGGFVKGRVTDAATGRPIAGVHMGVYGPATPMVAAAILGAETDAQGNYSIRTPAGHQYVYVSDMGGMGQAPPHHEADVLDGKATAVDFRLQGR